MADDDGFAPDPLDAMWPLLELEADVSGDVRTYYEGMSLRAESGLMTPRPDYFEEDFARDIGWSLTRVTEAREQLIAIIKRFQ